MSNLWGEVAAGLISGLLVSPFNTIVDKSVIQFSNGKTPLWTGVAQGLKSFAANPFKYTKTIEFRWIFLVYGSTYVSSNLADHVDTGGLLRPDLTKLLITFAVNCSTCIAKDRALAQAFGLVQTKSFPVASYLLFFVRDIFAMGSAFTLPPKMAKWLEQQKHASHDGSQYIAQISMPLLIQIIATPLHLVGLDLYNREQVSLSDRLRHLQKVYPSTLMLRMLRFLPAYGLGGIANIKLRKWFNRIN